jgi:ketosteroid isomerase-like protein
MGHDGVRQHLELLARDWEATRFDKLDIVAQADKVAVRIHLGLRHKPTGRAADLLKVDFWTVCDGKVVEFHQVLDSARLERYTG